MDSPGTKILHTYWADEPAQDTTVRLLAVIADQLATIATHLAGDK